VGFPPVVRNVEAAAEPNPVKCTDVFEKLDKTGGTGRATDQPVVQAD
jgi:hypothetical protein